MQGVGNTILSLQQAVFGFEKKLHLFVEDIGTGRLLHFQKLKNFRDKNVCEISSDFDLQQLVGFTRNLIQSFASRFTEFHERTSLFKFITYPHESGVQEDDLSFIPGICYRDFELELADLQVSDMWTKKFKLLNTDLEKPASQQAVLAMQHKWTELEKLQTEDQLISSTWNAIQSHFILCKVSLQLF